jgi:uncharacterized protein (DUF2235 family)
LLSRAIKQSADNGKIPQIVYYQKGVGSSLDLVEHIPDLSGIKDKALKSLFGGIFGYGLEDNVRAGYGFLAHNYNKGDEIYLFGFSRGAYTARSIAGLVSSFGLLNKKGMDKIRAVYQAYKEGCFADNVTNAKKSKGDHLRKTCGPRKVPIKCVGVWDTVGSLGIPDVPIAGFTPLLKALILNFNKQFQFHDTTLHPNIELGFHAYLTSFEIV